MYKTIVVCTDFSPGADLAVEAATELAGRYGAALHLVHVVPPFINPIIGRQGHHRRLAADDRSLITEIETQMHGVYAARLPAAAPHQIHVLHGHVSTCILDQLDTLGADLCVLGAYGLSGMDLLLFGSVARRVAHRAACSVLVVRPVVPSETP